MKNAVFNGMILHSADFKNGYKNLHTEWKDLHNVIFVPSRSFRQKVVLNNTKLLPDKKIALFQGPLVYICISIRIFCIQEMSTKVILSREIHTITQWDENGK